MNTVAGGQKKCNKRNTQQARTNAWQQRVNRVEQCVSNDLVKEVKRISDGTKKIADPIGHMVRSNLADPCEEQEHKQNDGARNYWDFISVLDCAFVAVVLSQP